MDRNRSRFWLSVANTRGRTLISFPTALLAGVLVLVVVLGFLQNVHLRRTHMRRLHTLEAERDEMLALVDWIGEAVISLSVDGIVLRTNRAAIDLLGLPDPTPVTHLRSVVRQPELRGLLEESLVGPFSSRDFSLGGHRFLVSARPGVGGGAVVGFLDVSEVRRLEIVRRDFVANVSHELKTPLTSVRGFTETLLEDDPPDDLRRSFLSSIRSNTLRLQHLVDDLLDLSRLESGGWVAKKETVDLGPVVEDLWDTFQERASARRLTFSQKGEATVVADLQGVIQVFQNLIDNAVRYTPDGGSIAVEIQRAGPVTRVEVRNTGSGIPASALPRVFERFFRVDTARARAQGGTGLGLAIVRHLVDAMGGRVWAQSKPGEGASFFVTLPGGGPEDGSGGFNSELPPVKPGPS